MTSKTETDLLHERIAKALGWTPKDVRSFDLPTLREIVRDRPKLVADINYAMAGGAHVTERKVR